MMVALATANDHALADGGPKNGRRSGKALPHGCDVTDAGAAALVQRYAADGSGAVAARHLSPALKGVIARRQFATEYARAWNTMHFTAFYS